MKFGKFSKKAISVVLAVAIIFSCITVSLTAFASTTPFSVTKASPAIPLYVGKTIDSGSLAIEIGGDMKDASMLTWARISGTSAKFSGGKFIGVSAGITKFEANDGMGSQFVYVIVNERNNSEFNLVNLNFNTDDFNADEWLEGSCVIGSGVNLPSGNYTYNHSSGSPRLDEGALMTGKLAKGTDIASKVQVNVGGTTKGALCIPAAVSHGGVEAVIYKNTDMNDFYDYTVEANMSNKMAVSGENNMTAAPGLLVRTAANFDAQSGQYIFAMNKTTSLRFRNYGGVSVYGINSNDLLAGSAPYESIPLWRQAPYTFYTEGTKDTYFMCQDKSKVFYPDAEDAASLTSKNVKIELKDIGIKYTYNGNVIFDSINNASKYSAFQMLLGDEADESMVKKDNIKEPVPSAASYAAMYKQNINSAYVAENQNKGTIGFINNYGNDLYIYDVKVTPANILDQSLPAMEELDPDFCDSIPVNTRYDLALDGLDTIWDNVKNEYYEVKDGILSVYAKPEGNTITVYGEKNGGGVASSFDVIDAGSKTDRTVTKFVDSEMTIKPVIGLANTYTVTISTANSNEVKHGTINLTDGDADIMVYNGIIGSSVGNEFEFTVANPSAMILSAEYTTEQENDASIYNLGSTARLTQGGNTEAIRFLTRIPAITKTPAGISLADEITVGEKTVTPVAVGSLLMPAAVLGQAELKFPENHSSGDFYINNCKVANVEFASLAKATDKYADAYTTISGFDNGGFGFNPLDTAIATVSYIKYSDNGKIGYIYSDNKTSDSYNSIIERAFPLKDSDITVEKAISGGTNHSFDSYDYTNDLSYKVGEEINFTYRINGAYTLNWELYKDDPASNLFGNETSQNSANLPVASGSTQQGEQVFTVTTKMNKPGTAKLKVTLTDSYGNTIEIDDESEDATFDTVVAAGAEDIKQPLEAANGKPADNDTVLTAMQTTFSARAAAINTALDGKGDELKTFLTTAAVGQSKTYGSAFTITCSKVSGGYRYFDFVIATNDTVGLTTTNATTGLFTDSVYATAASQSGQKAYNLRPATGCFAVPASADALTSIEANFADGYGCGYHEEGKANTIVINMNQHGFDNAKAAENGAYFNKLINNSPSEGGIVDWYTDPAESALTKATDSYAYGVIFRDYLALQISRTLFKAVMGKGPSKVSTNGTFEGGWQSLMVSALDTVITDTNAEIPWLATIGANEKYTMGKLDAEPTGAALKYFSSATAAQRIAATMSSRPSSYTVKLSGGLADTSYAPANGIISVYAALKNANCNKSITMKQFDDNTWVVIDDEYCYDNVLDGTYNSSEHRKDIDTGEGGDDPEPTEHTEWNFDNTYYKLTHDKKLSVAYIGGSVTWGSQTDKDCWRTQTADWFKKQYPNATITPIDCSMSGSSSVWASPRYNVDVISKKPDFVFIECSINDLYVGNSKGSTGLPKKEESAILMDSIIRRTQAALPNTDIVLITVVDSSTLFKGNVNADGHEAVAKYEKVMWLDMTDCTLEKVGKNLENWRTYFIDDVHPNATGHHVYTDYITSELSKKLAESAQRDPQELVPHTVAAEPYDPSVPTSFDIVYRESLDYSNKWTEINVQSDYNSKIRKFHNDFKGLRASQGATLTYSFKGTTLILLGEFQAGSNVVVTLDGGNTKSIGYNDIAGEVFLYSKLDPNVTHTVKLTVNGSARCDFSAFAVGKVD